MIGSMKTTALQNGYNSERELYGTATDPDALYISHGTWDLAPIVKTIKAALLRKLFKIADLFVADSSEILPFYDMQDSDGFKLVVERRNTQGASNSFETLIGAGVTFDSIVNTWNDFNTYVLAMLNDTDPELMSRMSLYLDDRNGLSTNFRHVATLNVLNEHMTIYFSSVIKIQNRTKSGDGLESADTDEVGNQPLAGQLFEFNSSHPKIKYHTATNQVLNRTSLSGVVITGAMNANFENPPDRSYFSNCVGNVRFKLKPGEIKYSSVFYKMSGKWNNLMEKIRTKVVGTTSLYGMPGKSQLLVFEELIRTSAATPIALQYERKYNCGAWLKTVKPVSFLSSLTKEAYNWPIV